MPIAKRWDEFGPTKAARAPEAPGVFEIGRMKPWPATDVDTIYIAGTPNLRKALEEEVSKKKGEMSGAQYLRYEETPDHEKKAQQLLTEYKASSGRLPVVNQARSQARAT
ncbi:MAG: hypothetical protein HY684_03760 [Chloroflexi bacterium]|nr:hypothetical protein [Chloroflexota bacterium]